jgi:hypothetical protein
MENRKIEMKNCILKFDFPYHIRNIFFNSNVVDMVVISFKIIVLGYWIDVTEPCMENREQFECHNWKNINLIANENSFRAN